ncbi:hypothetical protein ACTRXD_15705 [Nitrospira sp. T9]|uniref:hypothetical protein n=1 Tax=unclassified Nitrospira TaxID=2652172 RepID=UPI003F9689E3
MTVGVFIDRLEEFRQGVLQYREISGPDQGLTRNDSVGLESSPSNALRDTLCRQFHFIDESVGNFSRGRYRIHLDSRGREDIYVRALSEECQAEHLDLILGDLEHMLADLQQRPRHSLLAAQKEWPDNSGANCKPSFGSLGHLGSSPTAAPSQTLHAALNTVACVIHQRVDRSQDQEELLAHVQAILDHPKITHLLSFSPSH